MNLEILWHWNINGVFLLRGSTYYFPHLLLASSSYLFLFFKIKIRVNPNSGRLPQDPLVLLLSFLFAHYLSLPGVLQIPFYSFQGLLTASLPVFFLYYNSLHRVSYMTTVRALHRSFVSSRQMWYVKANNNKKEQPDSQEVLEFGIQLTLHTALFTVKLNILSLACCKIMKHDLSPTEIHPILGIMA